MAFVGVLVVLGVVFFNVFFYFVVAGVGWVFFFFFFFFPDIFISGASHLASSPKELKVVLHTSLSL